MLFKIRYWLSSKRRQMAKLHDLQRQLQEAWDERCATVGINALLEFANETLITNAENMAEQLHRVARERDQERKKRQTWERRSKEAWALNKILNEHIAAEA